MKQVLKVRKDKQSKALEYLQVNKLSKEVGVLYLNQTAVSCSIENFEFIVRSASALFINKTLITVSNP